MQKSYHAITQGRIPNSRVAILQAQWHSEHTDKMVKACRDLLLEAGCTELGHHIVPGSYELPLAAKRLAKLGRYDAIVIFGAIVKGDTDHYQIILDTCIRELGRVMYDYEVPIVMELMPVKRIEDLVARTEGSHNKGLEAAHAAIEIINWHRNLK